MLTSFYESLHPFHVVLLVCTPVVLLMCRHTMRDTEKIKARNRLDTAQCPHLAQRTGGPFPKLTAKPDSSDSSD